VSTLRKLHGAVPGGREVVWRSEQMATQEEKLKEQEKSRDFFCIVNDLFRIFARRSSIALGSAWTFTLAVVIILVWGLSGPSFHFSETWQLIINTGTTIVTFLMVFLIQNTQNRDSKAFNLKLDEIIRAVKVLEIN
jgi:hypothetical protein